MRCNHSYGHTAPYSNLDSNVSNLNTNLNNETYDLQRVVYNERYNNSVNFLPVQVNTLKLYNTAGTWNNSTNTYTIGNLSFAVSNGVVTVQGSYSGTVSFDIPFPKFTSYASASVQMSGCPSGGSSSTYRMMLQDFSGTATVLARDTGSGDSATLPSSYTDLRCRIALTNPSNVNLRFKPMITISGMPESDYDHFRPYAMSNYHLQRSLLITRSFTVPTFNMPEGIFVDTINVELPEGYQILGIVGYNLSRNKYITLMQLYWSNEDSTVSIGGYASSAAFFNGSITLLLIMR